MHEVNVVPLIDVSLVLVVILMLLTPLAFESNIAVHRAQQGPSDAPAAEPLERIEIAIVDETDVQVNDALIARTDLEATLRPLLAFDTPPPVVVSCADGVSHGTFVSVIDATKICGAKEIAVMDGEN
jgi:biopolymer transport protein TolR